MNIAIIIGISDYSEPMIAARNDAQRMHRLLDATGKYQQFLVVIDETTAANVKDKVRNFLRSFEGQQIEEIVFYYSGHGLYDAQEHEFYMLCSDYEKTRKTSTSLQNGEIDSFIRTLAPKLTVKLLDACFSGYRYLKSDPFERQLGHEKTLGNLIFMSSSHDNQTSAMIAEDSYFTAKFIEGALLSKIGDQVLYRDIVGYVADEFQNMRKQRPYFTTQGTGTEIFASYTDEMQLLRSEWYPEPAHDDKAEADEQPPANSPTPPLDRQESLLKRIATAIQFDERLYVDEAAINAALEKLKTDLSNYRIPDEVVGTFYNCSVRWDQRLIQLQQSNALTDMAVAQDWPQQYFVEFKTKPKKIKVPKRDHLSQMRFLVGQASESDYMIETHGNCSHPVLACGVNWAFRKRDFERHVWYVAVLVATADQFRRDVRIASGVSEFTATDHRSLRAADCDAGGGAANAQKDTAEFFVASILSAPAQ